jgi:hypothetical protein
MLGRGNISVTEGAMAWLGFVEMGRPSSIHLCGWQLTLGVEQWVTAFTRLAATGQRLQPGVEFCTKSPLRHPL